MKVEYERTVKCISLSSKTDGLRVGVCEESLYGNWMWYVRGKQEGERYLLPSLDCI